MLFRSQASVLPGRDMVPVTAEDSDEALGQVLRALPKASVPRAELGNDAEADQLRELLRLVLTSTALPEPDRTRAAAAVDEAARELSHGRGILDRLKVVSEIVARASDIAAPAADIIGRLIRAFS